MKKKSKIDKKTAYKMAALLVVGVFAAIALATVVSGAQTEGDWWTRDDTDNYLFPETTGDKVGLGDFSSSAPTAKLHVMKPSSGVSGNGILIEGALDDIHPNIKFKDYPYEGNANSANIRLYENNNDALEFQTQKYNEGSATTRLTITQDGFIGAGTTDPDAYLEINQQADNYFGLRLSYNDDDGSAANSASFSVNSGGALRIYTQGSGSTDDIILATAGFDNAIYIDNSTQRVGIGTLSPDDKFEIQWATFVDVEIGRGTTDTDITFITLRNAGGTKCYIYPNAAGNDIVVTTTKP